MQLTQPIILSYVQVAPLLKAKEQGLAAVQISPDLGLSTEEVTLTAEGAEFPSGERLDWHSAEKISTSEVNCFLLEENVIRPVRVFSEYTNRVCSLMPTRLYRHSRMRVLRRPEAYGVVAYK